MFHLGSSMIGDALTRAPHSHSGQICGDLYAPSDHRRIHGVVV